MMAPQLSRKNASQKTPGKGIADQKGGNEQYVLPPSPTAALAGFVGQVATPYLDAAAQLHLRRAT